MAVTGESVQYTLSLRDSSDEEVGIIEMKGHGSVGPAFGVSQSFAEDLRDWVEATYPTEYPNAVLLKTIDTQDVTEIP